MCTGQLRIRLRNSCEGNDHCVRQLSLASKLKIRTVMPNGDGGSHRTQSHHRAGLLDIGTGNTNATRQQDASDTGHTGTANANHVDTCGQLSRYRLKVIEINVHVYARFTS